MAAAPQMGILDLSPILCPSQSPFHFSMTPRQAVRARDAGGSLGQLPKQGDAWGGWGGAGTACLP